MRFCDDCRLFCRRCSVCHYEIMTVRAGWDYACIHFKPKRCLNFPKGKCKDCVNSGLTENKEYYCEVKEDVVSPKSTCGLFEPRRRETTNETL